MSSHARVNAEEAQPNRRTRRPPRRVAWRFWVIVAIVLCGFWELKAVIFGLNGMAHILSQGLSLRNTVIALAQVVASDFRGMIGGIGHWLIQLSH